MSDLLFDLYIKHIQTFIYKISKIHKINQSKLILDWNTLYKHTHIEPLYLKCMHILKGTDNYCLKNVA